MLKCTNCQSFQNTTTFGECQECGYEDLVPFDGTEVVTALDELTKASIKVLIAFEQDPTMMGRLNGDLNHYYPFDVCFEEIVSKLQTWSGAMTLAHQGKTVKEIDDNCQ